MQTIAPGRLELLTVSLLLALVGCAHRGASQQAPSADPHFTNPPPEVAPKTVEDSTEAPPIGEYVHLDELPEVIRKVTPQYPQAALAAGTEGTVIVDTLVKKDGSVGDVRVSKSLPGLDEAAMACVREWKFKPAMRGGKPVVVWVVVPVKFSLR